MTEEFPWNSAVCGGLCRKLEGNAARLMLQKCRRHHTHTHTLQECFSYREELACRRKKDTFTLTVLRLDPPTTNTCSLFYSHLQNHSCHSLLIYSITPESFSVGLPWLGKIHCQLFQWSINRQFSSFFTLFLYNCKLNIFVFVFEDVMLGSHNLKIMKIIINCSPILLPITLF